MFIYDLKLKFIIVLWVLLCYFIYPYYTQYNDNNIIFSCRTNKSFTIFSLTPESIRKHICLLPNKSNQSSDNIPKSILRQLLYQLAMPIYIIFSKYLNSQICPDSWYVGIIKPIFKKGDSTIASKYRLISSLPRLSLLFEKIFYQIA